MLRPTLLGMLVAACIIGLTCWMTSLSYQLNVRTEQRETSSLILGIESNIEQSMDYARLAARTMAHSIDANGIPVAFDSMAAELLGASPYLDAVQMVPGGVIRYTYPLKGHESVIGYDVLNEPKVNAEAKRAIERKQMYFAGPFELKQGGLAVVGRLPIFIHGEFWGFSAVIIRLDRLLRNAGIDTTGASGYYFQFGKVNPNTGVEEFFLPMHGQGKIRVQAYDFTSFPEGEWRLYVYPTDPMRTVYGALPVAFFGLLLALLSGLVVSRTLYRSENRFSTIFHQAADGIFIAGMDGRFKLVNPAATDMTGYTPEEFSKLTIADIMDRDHLTSTPLKIKEVNNGDSVRTDRIVRRKDGTVFDAEVIVRKLSDGSVQGVVRDITARKRARLALQNHAETLEKEVQERTQALIAANRKLAAQHRDITDSLRYAHRLQEVAIASGDKVAALFPYSFVMLRPKDEVSGDFYWAHETDRFRMVAVVDCTGHGVPGAMLSMLGLQMLNEVVVTQGITSPSEVLQRMDATMTQLLNQGSNDGAFDGMDMLFCLQEKGTNRITFADAQRPMFHVRNGVLTEYASSKFAIGGHAVKGAKVFAEKSITIVSGDCIYLTSDGFQSQFGGELSKKLNKRNFLELLESISAMPMEEQYARLTIFLEQWMKEEAQVDDVLVVGIRLQV